MAKRYTGELDRNNQPIVESSLPLNLGDYKSPFDVPIAEQTEYVSPFDVASQAVPRVEVSEFEHPYYTALDNEERRAQEQSGLTQLAYGLGNAVTGTLADMGSGASYLLDFEQMGNLANGTEQEFGNWFSEAMNKFKESTELPIYRTKASEGFSPWTTGWWASNMPSIFSTVALMVPAIGATGLAARGAKALGAAEAITALGGGLNEARALKGISSALISRYMENTMEGAQTMKSTYEDLVNKGYSEEEATNIAADAARQNWLSNTSNLAFDIPQYMMMFTPFKGAKAAFDATSAMSTAGKLGVQAGLEGVEEARQFISDKEAQRDAYLRAKISKADDSTYVDRIFDYAKDPEFWTSAFLGTLGGGIMGGIQQYREVKQDKIDKAKQSLIDQTLEKQRAVLLNDKIAFDQSDDKAFLDLLYSHVTGNSLESLERDLNELKQGKSFMANLSPEQQNEVVEKINDRLQDLQKYKEVKEKVDNEFLAPELKSIKAYNLVAANMLERRLSQTNKNIFDLTSNEVSEGVLDQNLADYRMLNFQHAVNLMANEVDPEVKKTLDLKAKEIIKDDVNYPNIKSIEDLNKATITSQNPNLLNEFVNRDIITRSLEALKETNAKISTAEGQKEFLEKLEKAKQEAKKKESEKIEDTTVNKLARGQQLTKEEKAYYEDPANKEKVEARVTAKKAAMEDFEPTTQTGKPIDLAQVGKEGEKKSKKKKKASAPTSESTVANTTSYKIQQYGTPNEITVTAEDFSVPVDQNGFPVYTNNKTGEEYKSTDGWFALSTGNEELAKKGDPNKVKLSSNAYFSMLWEYNLTQESKLLNKVFTKLHGEDPAKYPTPAEVVKEFPEAFPSIRAKEINNKITQLDASEWKKYIKIVVGEFYNKEGEPIKLANNLYGTKPTIDILLQVTDPETGETLRMHHPRNPNFFNYTDNQGVLRSVNFSQITKKEFDSLFEIGYADPKEATDEDFAILTSEWARSNAFFNSVEAYYTMQSQMPGFTGTVEYPVGDGYDVKIVGKFLIPADTEEFTALSKVPSLKDAPIINLYTKEMVRGEVSEFPNTTGWAYPEGYYVLYTHKNGFQSWVRLSPKKFETAEEVLPMIEEAQRKLLEIPKEIVGTSEGNKRAAQIAKDLGIFVASRTTYTGDVDERMDLRHIQFSTMKSSKTNSYLLQIEADMDNTGSEDLVNTRFVFADEKDQVRIFNSVKELEKALAARGLNLDVKKDFRRQVPKVIPAGQDINSYFDIITSPDIAEFKFRFSFPETKGPGNHSGLPGFNLPTSTKKASETKSTRTKKQIEDKKKKGKSSQEALAEMIAENKLLSNEDLSEDILASKKKRSSKRKAKAAKKESEVVLTTEEIGEGITPGLKGMTAALFPLTAEELKQTAAEEKKQKEQDKKAAAKVEPTEKKPINVLPWDQPPVVEAAETKESKPSEYAGKSKEEKRELRKKKQEEDVAKRMGKKNMLASYDLLEPENYEEAKAILEKELPAGISVKEMEPLLEKVANGKVRLGFVLDNMVYLSKKATVKTAYHEATHIVLDALISSEKLASYRRLAKQELNLTPAQLSKRIADLKATGEYDNVSDQELENLVYDEHIADKRADYSAKRGARPSNVWTKLFDFIQRVVDFLTGNKSLNALYRKMERGAFKKADVLRKSDLVKNKLIGSLNGAETEELISTIAGNYIMRRGEKNPDGSNVTIAQIMNEFANLYDPESPENVEYLTNNPSQEDALTEYYFILENVEDNEDRLLLKKQVAKKVKSFIKGFTAEELEEIDEIFNEDIQEDHAKEQQFDKAAHENDPYLGLSGEVRAFFGTTVYKSRDRFGKEIYKAVDPSTMYSKLLPILCLTETPSDFVINKLRDYARVTEDAAAQAVYDRIIAETGYTPEMPEGTSETGKLFLNRFKDAFALTKKLFVEFGHGPKGYTAFHLNKTGLGKNIYNTWFSNYQDSPAQKLVGEVKTAEDKQFKKELLALFDQINNKWNPKSSNEDLLEAAEKIKQLFNKLGMSVITPYLHISLGIEGAGDQRSYPKVTFITQGFLKGLKNRISSNADIYGTTTGGRNSSRSSIKKVAAGNATFLMGDVTEVTPTMRVGDKTYYSYSTPDLTSSTAQDLNENITIERIQELKKDPYFMHNPIMQLSDEAALAVMQNMHVAIIPSFKNKTTGELILTGEMDNRTAAALYLAMFSTKEGDGTSRYYHLRQYEAKNTQYSATLPKYPFATYQATKGVELNDMAQNMLYNMFVQETKRMADKQAGYLANKGDKGPQRIYFKFLQDLALPSDFLQNYTKPEYKQMVMKEMLAGFKDMVDQYYQKMQDFKLDKSVSKEYLSENYNSPDDLKFYHMVYDMIINDFVWTNGLLQMIEGDIAWAKNYADFVKRGSGGIASGLSFKGMHKVYFVGDFVKYYDADYVEKTDVPKDPKELKEYLKKNKDVVPVTANDGSNYSIPQSRLKDLKSTGKATPAQLKALERLINPLVGTGQFYTDATGNEVEILRYEPLTTEEIELLDLIPKKEVVRGRTVDGKEIYEKMSVVWLSKTLTSKWNQDLQKWVPLNAGSSLLHNYREFLEKEFEKSNGEYTVHLATKSASKLYFPDDVKSFEIEESKANLAVAIDNKYRRNQVENDTKDKKTIPLSLQVNGNADSELFSPKGREARAAKDATFNQIKNEIFNVTANLVREINAETGEMTPANLEIFLRSKQEQVQAAQTDSQLIEMLEPDPSGRGSYSFNMPHLYKKFESLFITSFKQAFRHQMSGRKLTMQATLDQVPVLIDSNGNEIRIVTRAEQAEDYNNDYSDKSKYKLRDLNFLSLGERDAEVVNEDGSISIVKEQYIKPAEVMMTRRTAEMMGINITDPSRADYLRAILSRFPNQNYHSNAPAVIVDFLPEEYGDTIVGPHQLVLMMGADFDIDSLYTMMQDMYLDKQGKVKRYGEETTEQDKYLAWRNWWLKNNKFIRDHRDNLIDSNLRYEKILSRKDALEARAVQEGKKFNKATEELLARFKDLQEHEIKIFSEDETVAQGYYQNRVTVDFDLSEKFFAEILSGIEKGKINSEVGALAFEMSEILNGIREKTFRDFNMPSTFEEWQAAGSPESVGALNNRLFDSYWNMFTDGKLWTAYKDYLKDTAIQKAYESIDLTNNMVEMGNSIPTKLFAQATNSASKQLRGLIVSAAQFGMFARKNGLRLAPSNYITFIDAQGNTSTITDYPTIPLEYYSEEDKTVEIQELEKFVRKISDTGSQMVGIVIDDPKNPKIWALNWTENTLGQIADGISLGLDADYLFKVFSLPIFKKMDVEINNRKSPIAPVVETDGSISGNPKFAGKAAALDYYSAILGRIKKYIASQSDPNKSRFTEKQYSVLTTEYEFNPEDLNGTESNPKDNMINFKSVLDNTSTVDDIGKLSYEKLLKEYNFYSLQLKAFSLYQQLDDVSSARANTVGKLAALNKTSGSTNAEVNAYVEAYQAVEANTVFENLGEVVDNDVLMSGNVARIKELQDATSLYFITQADFFNKFFPQLKGMSSFWTSDKEEYVRRLGLVYITSAMYRNANKDNPDFTPNNLTLLMRPGSPKAMTIRRNKLIKTYPAELSNNAFLKLVSIKAFKKAGVSEEDVEEAVLGGKSVKESPLPLNFLIFDSFTKLPPKVQTAAMDGHTSMLVSEHEEVRQFALDVIPYLMVKDGLAFTSNSIAKIVDIYQYKEISNMLQDLMDTDKAGREALYGKSEEQIADEFIENFLRTEAFHSGYLNFISRFAMGVGGIKVVTAKDRKTFTVSLSEKVDLGKIQKTARKLKTNISGIESHSKATYPRYFLFSVKSKTDFGSSVTNYIGKRVSKGTDVAEATYEILPIFNKSKDKSLTTMFFTPEENARVRKAMTAKGFAAVKDNTIDSEEVPDVEDKMTAKEELAVSEETATPTDRDDFREPADETTPPSAEEDMIDDIDMDQEDAAQALAAQEAAEERALTQTPGQRAIDLNAVNKITKDLGEDPLKCD